MFHEGKTQLASHIKIHKIKDLFCKYITKKKALRVVY